MMKTKAGRVIVACCGFAGIAVLLIVAVIGKSGLGLTQEAPQPTLFALDYPTGHELAGFTGRPMVLVFSDSRVPGWQDFMLACEQQPELAALLSAGCQGVFVDLAKDAKTYRTYGAPPTPSVLVKDLRGPVLGYLEKSFTPDDLLKILGEALPRVRVEPSPALHRLRGGTDLLDELKEKNEVTEASRVLGLFKLYEGDTPAYFMAQERAKELGIPVSE